MERAKAEPTTPTAVRPREPADPVYERPQVAWEEVFEPTMACSPYDEWNPDCKTS